MRLCSWNVNGIRACLGKGFMESFAILNPDVLCLQETKCQPGQVDIQAEGYRQFWLGAEKKGYSSTAVLTRITPLDVRYGMGVEDMDHEGRMITVEFDDFCLINVYTPNSQDGLARLPFRMEWENQFLQYVLRLEERKPVVICGDLNVAHQEIDIKNPKANIRNAGFTQEERDCMTRLLAHGYIDTFRHLNPDVTGAYSWWSYRFHARENNAGWRIDYFLISRKLESRLRKAEIQSHIYGSDHCPVTLELE